MVLISAMSRVVSVARQLFLAPVNGDLTPELSWETDPWRCMDQQTYIRLTNKHRRGMVNKFVTKCAEEGAVIRNTYTSDLVVYLLSMRHSGAIHLIGSLPSVTFL